VTPPYVTSAPFFVAADLGLFAAEGIDVELVEIAHTNASLPALASGKVDVVGTVLNAALFNLIARGAEVKIVASRAYEAAQGCAANAIVARKSLIEQGRLAGPETLRGLRVSVDLTGHNAYLLDTVLDRGRLAFEDLELSNLIDVTLVIEPALTQVLDTGAAAVWLPANRIAPDAQYTFVLFGERLLERERDLGERFMRAYLRGVELYVDEEKSPRLVEILAARTHLDPDFLRRMCWPPTVRDGRIDRDSLERYQDWAIGRKLIDGKIDVSKMIDTGFLAPPAVPSSP
jgi:NitT/TauT family transport system substrate-binding protein